MTPTRTALLLGAGDIVVTVAGALAVAAIAPHASAWTARLVVVLVLAAAVAALLAAMRAWHLAGLTTLGTHHRLLVVPALVALAPLAGGVRLPAPGLLTILVVGYLATGFVEEALFRGVILGVLRPVGVPPAVFISAGLFAAAHLPNMLFGQAPAITVAQAVGTFCFGVGYAAVRWCTAGIVPLIGLHFLTDLLLRVDALPTAAHWAVMVGGDTVLLIYGLVLLHTPKKDAA